MPDTNPPVDTNLPVDIDPLADTGMAVSSLRCLFCGSTDDIAEVLVTIDDRTSEYALLCCLCEGIWTP